MWQDPAHAPEVAYTADEALAMDRWLVERGFTIPQLMGTAGARLAEAAAELCAGEGLEAVVCLVGPGNNGGDALVAADLLESADRPAPADRPSSRAQPALAAHPGPRDRPEASERAQPELRVTRWRPLSGEPAPPLGPGTLVIDGLFGVGLVRPVEGAAAQALEAVAASGAPVLAVDVPSGLHATSGRVLGVALPARWTLTFVGPKTGFFVHAGPAHVGRWRAVDIGFPVGEAHAWLAARRAASGTSLHAQPDASGSTPAVPDRSPDAPEPPRA